MSDIKVPPVSWSPVGARGRTRYVSVRPSWRWVCGRERRWAAWTPQSRLWRIQTSDPVRTKPAGLETNTLLLLLHFTLFGILSINWCFTVFRKRSGLLLFCDLLHIYVSSSKLNSSWPGLRLRCRPPHDRRELPERYQATAARGQPARYRSYNQNLDAHRKSNEGLNSFTHIIWLMFMQEMKVKVVRLTPRDVLQDIWRHFGNFSPEVRLSILECSDENRYFKSNHDVFWTLTKCF